MKVINVECRCKEVLLKYQKVGTGKLIRCYLNRVINDNIGISKSAKIGDTVYCPNCKEQIGTVFGIRGVLAVKLKQNQIQPFRLD